MQGLVVLEHSMCVCVCVHIMHVVHRTLTPWSVLLVWMRTRLLKLMERSTQATAW